MDTESTRSEAETAAEAPSETPTETSESFGEMLAEFEHSHKKEPGQRQLEGTVLSLSADSVFVDIGYKVEGVLPRSAFPNNAEKVQVGDKLGVSSKGRNAEGYYDLSLFRVSQPRDWSALEEAFAQKTPIVGTVTAVVKGGLSVDVGVRAFMPQSRSGARDEREVNDLVGQEITCRIIKLDVGDEDVVVDRRSVLEEQALAQAQSRAAGMNEGDVVEGTVRNLMPYGAFIDLGGVDGLLHVSDLSWARVGNPEDVLTAGQKVQVKILKIDPETRKISLGMKQLQAEPWEAVPGKYKAGDRVTGRVVRLMDFGAFVELEPGVEGLIHVSEMSWVKKVRKPSDILKEGDTVEAVILSVQPVERRIALGLKQLLGDPWADAAKKFPVGSAVEGPVTQLMKFGAFVRMGEGVEGLIHVSEISAEKHIHHPQDVLKVGQVVRAQVLAIDAEKRQAKLSMKQMVPTSLKEYLEEHKEGDGVSGRVIEVNGDRATVELGEGIRAACLLQKGSGGTEEKSGGGANLSALTSMLQARWKGQTAAKAAAEPVRVGQIRSFRITKIDREGERVEVALG